MTKILLIEDDPLMIRLYEKELAFKGYSVDSATNGEEGIAKVKSYSPDLVLPDLIVLDIMLPKMNGMEVLDRLKADPTTKSIPIIMLTNLASEKNEEIALSKGVNRYLIKDENDPSKIAEIVNETLSPKH